jgi:hypothetical protein
MPAGPTYVAKDPLDESPMGIARAMHVEASLIDGVYDVRACEGEVLKCSGNVVVEGGIRSRRAISGQGLGASVNWSLGQLAVHHAGVTKDLLSVLCLVKKEPRDGALHMNAKEVVQRPEIFHGGGVAEVSSYVLKKR